jgi:hypothetical protein
MVDASPGGSIGGGVVSEYTVHRVGSFVARDGGGTEYRVVIYGRYERNPGAARVPAGADLLTDHGVPVERVARGRYLLHLPGGSVPLASDDPAAP